MIVFLVASWSRAFFLSFALTFLITFINSHLCCYNLYERIGQGIVSVPNDSFHFWWISYDDRPEPTPIIRWNALQRFYDPDEGHIELDGRNIKYFFPFLFSYFFRFDRLFLVQTICRCETCWRSDGQILIVINCVRKGRTEWRRGW